VVGLNYAFFDHQDSDPEPYSFYGTKNQQYKNKTNINQKPTYNYQVEGISKVYNPIQEYGYYAQPIAQNQEEENEMSWELMHELATNRLKKGFWYLIALLIFLPLLKSGIFNSMQLIKNIGEFTQLTTVKSKLIQDKQNINGKLKDFASSAGKKRTIKEEIKVIEENEILIKIVP